MNKSEIILLNALRERIEEYLKWNIKQTEDRFLVDNICHPKNYAVQVLDLPIFEDEKKYFNFFKIANQCGYQLLNIGLTSLQDRKIKYDTLKIAEQHGMRFVSAHGTSVKRAIKQGTQFKEILENDLYTLEKIDPLKKMIINYDCFAGHLPNLKFVENFEFTKDQNIKQLAQSLDIKIESEHSFIEYIINNLAKVFVDTERKITVEIPGTKGWSMLPEITYKNLSFLSNLIDDIFPKCKITIDLAHLLTWSKQTGFLAEAVEMIKPYQEKIAMLHISSAGADNHYFINAYKLIHKNRYPTWHAEGLDLSLFVYEKEMLYLISELRNMLKHDFYEVAETRLPSVAIKDYFPNFLIEDLDHFYSKGLFLQSKLLNYL